MGRSRIYPWRRWIPCRESVLVVLPNRVGISKIFWPLAGWPLILCTNVHSTVIVYGEAHMGGAREGVQSGLNLPFLNAMSTRMLLSTRLKQDKIYLKKGYTKIISCPSLHLSLYQSFSASAYIPIPASNSAFSSPLDHL